MADPQRRAKDLAPGQQRPAAVDGLWVTLLIAGLAFLGGLLPRQEGLPPLWPAAPILMGLMLRFPRLSHGWSWLGALCGLTAVQYLHGSPLLPALWIALGSELACVLGYLTLAHLNPQSRSLRSTASVLHMLLACLVASVVDGVFYALIAPALKLGLPPHHMLTWFATSLVCYVALLPLVLTWPSRSLQSPRWNMPFQPHRMELRLLMPVLVLVVCTTAAWVVQGKATPVYTLPALLWCAFAYPLFASTLLTGSLGMLFFLTTVHAFQLLPAAALPTSQWQAEHLALAALMMPPLMVASIMTSHRELEHRLRMVADFDSLTRLPVRNAFFQWGNHLLQHRYAQQLPVSVLLLDVDQLQQVNQTYGHAAGDRVLAALGRHLLGSLRRQDCVGRLAGDEFAVIVSNETHADAQQVIARLCQDFATLPIALEHGETVYCSISAGGVTTPRPTLSLPLLLQQAEQALRSAKRRGRGQWLLELFQAPTKESSISPVPPPVLTDIVLPDSAAAKAHATPGNASLTA